MPKSVKENLDNIKNKALEIAKEAGSIGEMQANEEPVAFGLKAVMIMAMYTVESSDFDGTAGKMSKIKGVQSAEVAKMDLALG